MSDGLELVRVDQQLEPHVGEATVQGFVIGLPDGRDDVGGTDRPPFDLDAGRRTDEIVAGVGAPLGEQRLDVAGEFARRRVAVSLRTWIPARAALHPPVPLRELREVAVGQIEHGTPQFEWQPRSECSCEIGFLTEVGEHSFDDLFGVCVDPVGLGPHDRELVTQIPAQSLPAGEPPLRSCLVVGVVGEDRRDVVVPGDPEPVADPIAIARMMLAEDRQEPVRRSQHLVADQLPGREQVAGLRDPFALVHLVGAIARGRERFVVVFDVPGCAHRSGRSNRSQS